MNWPQGTGLMDGPPPTNGNPLPPAATKPSPDSHRESVNEVFVIPHGLRDIVSRLQMSKNRNEIEDTLLAIFGQSTVGIAQMELSGRFAFVNQRYCEIVGRSAEELYDRRIQDITHADDQAVNLSQFKRLVTEGRECTVEKRCVRPDGSCVWVHNSLSLIRDQAGTPNYAVAFTLDVSESKRTECERERLLDREHVTHDELFEIDRRKDEFLALLGHELRNPLSDVVSAMQIMEQLDPPDATARDMLGVIKRQSLHMTKLIDDLLDLSRIACGKIALNMVRLDIVSLVRNAVADHEHHVDTNQLALVLELPNEPIWVVGDDTRLCQVVSNLLHNATKFTNPGGTISVSIRRERTAAVINMRDTGIGMEPYELAGLFEPFRQAESIRVRSKGGLGLGLALSKRLIERHGGAISAASDGFGQGSVFTVKLPLGREATPALSKPTRLDSAPAAALRILIVDDRRDARLTLTVLLERLGHHVAQAENGAAALETAGSFRPQMVLCDVGLPDMDGYAVARAMRADPWLNGARLVALTGYGRPEDRDLALKAGFDRHVTKPISFEQLQELLQEAR